MEHFGFIGSTKEKKDFADLLHRLSTSAPPRLPILMYYGQSGNGKSTFLQQLQRHCDEKSVSWVALNLDASPNNATAKITTLEDAIQSLAETAKRDFADATKISLFKRLIADLEKDRRNLKTAYKSKASFDSGDAISLGVGLISGITGYVTGSNEIGAAITVVAGTAPPVVKSFKNRYIDHAHKYLAKQNDVD